MNTEKNNYQKQYRKHRVHRIIIFSQEEYKILMGIAEQQRKPFGTLVRELALAQASNRYIIPYEKQTHRVKILLIRYGTNLNQIAHVLNSTKAFPKGGIDNIKKEFSKMQKGIMKIYNEPIQVKDLVHHTLIKNPDYLEEIELVLKEFKK